MSLVNIAKDGEAALGEARGRLDVLLVHEDLSTELRARQAFEQVRPQIEMDADVDLWKFDLFREPGLLERAATEAAKADIVFLSAHGQGELPARANKWLERWFESRSGEPSAVVVLLDTPAGDTAAADQRWEGLRAAALAARVDVFLDAGEALQTERQMRTGRHFREVNGDGKVIAGFGQAKLVKGPGGKYELRGGLREDRMAAREWISMFWHEAALAAEGEPERVRGWRVATPSPLSQ